MSKPFNIKKVRDINHLDYINVTGSSNFDNAKIERYEVCSHFGCGKRLRLEEILAGGRCHEHTNKKRK